MVSGGECAEASEGEEVTLLLTGATGTFGRAFLDEHSGDQIRAFSRDEFKQSELRGLFPNDRWLLGDVRDLERLRRAVDGCDTVIHAAALKQVPAGEYNPGEFVKTNVIGSMNVVEACLDRGVERAVLISSDKAVHPVNVYGATKLCAEKLWLAANAYGGEQCKFSVVRYGNVRGSRGSVHERGRVSLTDARATRFWMEPGQAVELVLLALREMQGGEVFVPKLDRSLVADAVDHDGTETGLRPGEKLHEQLISDEEVGRTYDFGDHFRVLPVGALTNKACLVPSDFMYTSAA